MKTVKFIVNITQNDNGYYFAEVENVPGVYTQGDSFQSIKEHLKEALELHLEGLAEDGELKEEWKGEPAFNFRMSIPAALSLLGLENKNLAYLSGINSTLLSQYKIGNKQPSMKQINKLNNAIHQLGDDLRHMEVV